MDASSQASGRSLEPVVDIDSVVPRRDSGRTLTVTAVYHLSEEGRKASLLDGGDGRAVQEVKLAVPTSRFHLVSVDADGAARLKLQPRYFLDEDQNVRRGEGPPVYNVPPSPDDLLRDAARNHQLERAYNVEQAEKKSTRLSSSFAMPPLACLERRTTSHIPFQFRNCRRHCASSNIPLDVSKSQPSNGGRCDRGPLDRTTRPRADNARSDGSRSWRER
jgi:hypothetical protein